MKLKESREDDEYKNVEAESMVFIESYPLRCRPSFDYIIPGQHCFCGRSRFLVNEKNSTMNLNSYDRMRYYKTSHLSDSIIELNHSARYLTKKNVTFNQLVELNASTMNVASGRSNRVEESRAALKKSLNSPSNATLIGSIERRLTSSVSTLQRLFASSSKFVDLFRGIALYYFFCLNTILARNDILKRKTFSVDNASMSSLDLPITRKDVDCFDTLNRIFNALKEDSLTGKSSTLQFANYFDRKIMKCSVEEWFLDAMLRGSDLNRADFHLLILLSQKEDWLPSTTRSKYRMKLLHGYFNDINYWKMVLFAAYIENNIHEDCILDDDGKAFIDYLRKSVLLYPPDLIDPSSLHDVIYPSFLVLPPSLNYLMPRPCPLPYYPSEPIYQNTLVISEVSESEENITEKNYISSNCEQNNLSPQSSDLYPTSTGSLVDSDSTDSESTDTGYTSREKETRSSSPEKNDKFKAAVEEFLSEVFANNEDVFQTGYGDHYEGKKGNSVENRNQGEEEIGIPVEEMLPTGLLEDDINFPQYNMWKSSFELTENFRKLRSSVDLNISHEVGDLRRDPLFTDRQIRRDSNFSLFSNGDARFDAGNTREIKNFDMWMSPQFGRCLPELKKMVKAKDPNVDILAGNSWDSKVNELLNNNKHVFFTNSGAFEYYKKARSMSMYESQGIYDCDKEELDLDAEIEAIFKHDATDAEYTAAGLNKDYHFVTIDPVPRVAVDPQPKYSVINSCTFWVEGRPNRYMIFKHELDDPDAPTVFQPRFEMSKKDVACQVDFFMATHGSQSTNFKQAEYSLFPQAGSQTFLSTVLNNTNGLNSSSRYSLPQCMSRSMNCEIAGCSMRNSIPQNPSSVSFFSTNNFLENSTAGCSYMS